MLPFERQNQILKWLTEDGTLSISEISNRLNVSEMTVYRDIKPLIEENKINKTSGGISLVTHSTVSPHTCTYCLKELNNRHPMQIITLQQTVEQFCCPHCGLLRYKDIEKNVSQIICRDFLQHTTISAKLAYYLFDADFNLNCCKPQVLTFDSLKYAEQFQKGFGGTILRFDQALDEVTRRMTGDLGCGCHK
ncbi:DeoR family transcriptional regulator [Neobacillus cucumis]|uniref:DeoR family transcriptional regulator n=1 Tax=Neobacillus cucumis TaxID=1740721 RepID=UPI002E2416F3|nr:DeoR family transcriptional regulator [Neobacillus cucumis]MED4227215.1 DeoR family transcriptional regulator [Neobacillus cucumis]